MTVTVIPSWDSFDNFYPAFSGQNLGFWPTLTRSLQKAVRVPQLRRETLLKPRTCGLCWLACYQTVHSFAQKYDGPYPPSSHSKVCHPTHVLARMSWQPQSAGKLLYRSFTFLSNATLVPFSVSSLRWYHPIYYGSQFRKRVPAVSWQFSYVSSCSGRTARSLCGFVLVIPSHNRFGCPAFRFH